MIYSADTLIYDSAKIAEYQADKRYDYNSQLATPEINLAEIIFRWLSRFFSRFFDTQVADTVTWWFLVIFFVTAVALVAFFIYKKRPELFIREKKKPVRYTVEEETIYGVDFEKELSVALSTGDYRTAIRILYLQTLRFLSDKEFINWQIYKAPTEYIYELKPDTLKTPFRIFTNHFLQVRYGNFKATSHLFETMKSLQDELRKEVTDEE